ncbi:MAG: hypothetical protein JSW07_12720 [bacterium]|nr:MAG: hypothetical protein JSW07_12720 [bacterium]
MKRVIYILGITIIVLAMVSTTFASLNQFVGRWQNIDPNTKGVTTLNIVMSGTKVTVHAWGKCHPQDCDWGTVDAIAYAPNVSSNLVKTARALSAVFKTDFSNTLMVIKPLKGKQLQAEVFTHFTSGGRTDYNAVYKFEPKKSTLKEDCVKFNPKTTTVAQKQGRWKVVDGSHWLFDFDNKKSEADKALKIIKHYGMNSSCFVGRPDPSFQYMLVSGKAPVGSFGGEDCVSFNPNTIEVKKINGRWKIVDGSHWLFDFENKESEARQAFAIIKKYGFKFSCFVGRPNPSFQYLRK